MIRIAGVVVIYDPSPSLLQNIRTYLPDVEVLYVFDNSPGRCVSIVEKVCRLEKLEYLTLGANVGIPTALNIAARKSIEKGFDYLLTMDQDSYASAGMIRTMLSAAAGDSSIGLITPFHIDRSAPTFPPDKDIEPLVTAMTSGNLVDLAAYKKVGGFLEKLFIDYVDVEYCLRLQEEGFSVVRANRAVLSHTLGRSTPRRFFGKVIQPTNHSPARFFYQARNRVYLRRRYRYRFPEYFRYESRLHRGRLVKMLFYEEDRLRKTVMVLRGLLAAWRDDFSPLSMP